jgi:hypothetical protein
LSCRYFKLGCRGRRKLGKVLTRSCEEIPAEPYPVFKPLSSSGYQIAALIGRFATDPGRFEDYARKMDPYNSAL